MSRRVRVRGLLLSALGAVGCGHAAFEGPPFRPALISADTALIYVYRADGSSGGADTAPVLVDGVPLGWFFRPGYVPFHARPGNHVLEVPVRGRAQKVDLRVEPNAEYYVRYDLSSSDATLTAVPARDGRAEIASSHLLPGGYDGRDRL